MLTLAPDPGGAWRPARAVFRGVDADQLGPRVGFLAGLGGGVVGVGGGELDGEAGGAVVAEDVLVEEGADGGHEGVFADGDAAVVGVGGGVAGLAGSCGHL
ncbi:MAG TPA: hypothetical protein VIY52_21230 [Streptosporangiaceae bacterium]